MKATLRSFHSPDFDLANDLDHPGVDQLLVQMMVGPDDGPGEESFDVLIRTWERLKLELDEFGLLQPRHELIQKELNLTIALAHLRAQVESLEAPTWGELAALVARIGKWEFEDYTSPH